MLHPSHVSLAIVYLVKVFELNAVKYVARNSSYVVGQVKWETVSELELHFVVSCLEYYLESQSFNAVLYSHYDWPREGVTCQGRCSCFLKHWWLWNLNFLWGRGRCAVCCVLVLRCERWQI